VDHVLGAKEGIAERVHLAKTCLSLEAVGGKRNAARKGNVST
jgi:hypothetical protein